MNYLRYWARYVRNGEVKGGGIKNGNESTSHCVISIIIVIAPTILRRFNHGAYTRKTK